MAQEGLFKRNRVLITELSDDLQMERTGRLEPIAVFKLTPKFYEYLYEQLTHLTADSLSSPDTTEIVVGYVSAKAFMSEQ